MDRETVRELVKEAKSVISDLLDSIEVPANNVAVWYELSAIDYIQNAKNLIVKLDSELSKLEMGGERIMSESILTNNNIDRINLLANAILASNEVIEIHTVALEILYEVQQIKDSGEVSNGRD
jgi:hypothetical protein